MTGLTDLERDQRLECLRLAVVAVASCDTVKVAGEFYAFVSGKSEQPGRFDDDGLLVRPTADRSEASSPAAQPAHPHTQEPSGGPDDHQA